MAKLPASLQTTELEIEKNSNVALIKEYLICFVSKHSKLIDDKKDFLCYACQSFSRRSMKLFLITNFNSQCFNVWWWLLVIIIVIIKSLEIVSLTVVPIQNRKTIIINWTLWWLRLNQMNFCCRLLLLFWNGPTDISVGSKVHSLLLNGLRARNTQF